MNILIIGVGYHARRIYLPFFIKEKGTIKEVNLVCGVDLVEQKQVIEEYLFQKDFPLPMTYVEDEVGDVVKKENEVLLHKLVQKFSIDSVIIATEPLAHFKYAKWALENDLNILMDKPITSEIDISTSERKAKKIVKDFLYLKKLYLKKKNAKKVSTFCLLSQRRFHPAYIFVKEKLDEVRASTQCPVTSIQASHSDGQWRMPKEIIVQNYHPYNQGYGKCSHSGYHTLDIVTWLTLSQAQGEKHVNNADVYATFVRPKDLHAQLNFADYRKLFPDFDQYNPLSEAEYLKKVESFGEIDAFSTITFKHDDDAICLGSVNLIHNGFSQRSWVHALNRDLYKGNGRVRQESFFIEQGPFQSIALISYQSQEISQSLAENLYEVGGEYHLDIHIFRNSNLFPQWKAHEKYNVSSLSENMMEGYSRGHQEDARRQGILDFISSVQMGEVCKSDLLVHENSTNILSALYRSA
jgi:predicted dehydrogenase